MIAKLIAFPTSFAGTAVWVVIGLLSGFAWQGWVASVFFYLCLGQLKMALGYRGVLEMPFGVSEVFAERSLRAAKRWGMIGLCFVVWWVISRFSGR